MRTTCPAHFILLYLITEYYLILCKNYTASLCVIFFSFLLIPLFRVQVSSLLVCSGTPTIYVRGSYSAPRHVPDAGRASFLQKVVFV